jgi:hypothetical protein
MNVTIALDDVLAQKAREHAARQQTTLNGLIRQLLEEAVNPRSSPAVTFDLMDQANGKPSNRPWRREDLYGSRIR